MFGRKRLPSSSTGGTAGNGPRRRGRSSPRASAIVSADNFADPDTGPCVVRDAVETSGRLDVLVNNAGVFKPKPFLNLDGSQHDWFLDTILKGKRFAAQAAARAMKETGGAIVQTG